MGHFPRYSSGIIWLNYTNVTCAKPTWLSDMQLDATTLHTLAFVGSDSIHTTILRYPKSLPRGKNISPKGIQAQTRNVPEVVQWGAAQAQTSHGEIRPSVRLCLAGGFSSHDALVSVDGQMGSSVLLVCLNPPRAIHLGLDSVHSEITRRGQALPSAWACWAEEGIDSAITGNRQGKLRVYLDEKSIFRYKARHFQRWQSTLGRWVKGGHQATVFYKN